ncbi:hypothetical protein MD484_g4819, partial [Candolleomyces efflorescens]
MKFHHAFRFTLLALIYASSTALGAALPSDTWPDPDPNEEIKCEYSHEYPGVTV